MKKRLLATLLVLGNLLMPVSAYANGEEYALEGSGAVDKGTEISPRIAVKKFVSVTVTYAKLNFVPKTYFYSYYDHDYSIILKGYLPLEYILDCNGYVEAVFSGYVSGSI